MSSATQVSPYVADLETHHPQPKPLVFTPTTATPEPEPLETMLPQTRNPKTCAPPHLSNVNGRVKRPSKVHHNVRFAHGHVSRERVNLHFGCGSAVREVVERTALSGGKVEVQVGRAVEAVRRQVDALEVACGRQLGVWKYFKGLRIYQYQRRLCLRERSEVIGRPSRMRLCLLFD